HRVEEADPPLGGAQVGEVPGGVDQEGEAELLEHGGDEETEEGVAETPPGHVRATVTGRRCKVDRDPAVETRWAPVRRPLARAGLSPTPGANHLGLLPSGPDPVRGAPPPRTRPSTPRFHRQGMNPPACRAPRAGD